MSKNVKLCGCVNMLVFKVYYYGFLWKNVNKAMINILYTISINIRSKYNKIFCNKI